MNTVNLNPLVAVELNINPVGQLELVPIFLDAESDWDGTYEFKLWNSAKKNDEISSGNALQIDGTRMTINIDPSSWAIKPDEYYYEITSKNPQRVLFKGTLTIIP